MMGTIGYCMGGPMIMRTAAARPDRIGAAASFHGGGLATDAADSPHRLIPRMSAQLLIAIAENDDMNDPEAKSTLRELFPGAGARGRDRGLRGHAAWLVPARLGGLQRRSGRASLEPATRIVRARAGLTRKQTWSRFSRLFHNNDND
jgi:dienelactone hydrolase